jgi:hypothetical protein
MPKPDFKHTSWDATFWSLWGLIYTGAASDTALKTAITTKYDETQTSLGKLGPQVDPMKAKVKEWRAEVDGYGRTITFGEANDVLARLTELHREIGEQVQRDAELVKAGKKPNAKKEKAKVTSGVSAPSDPYTEDDELISEDDLAWMLKNQNTGLGHSPATAKERPKAKKYVPPTPEEIWTQEQRDMASRCDNGIKFGAHAVNQASVLSRLGLAADDGSVNQYRVGSENSHERVMVSGKGIQLWTLGLSHQERRDAGNYSVYRRDGAKSRFTFVGGRRHPKDPTT